MTGLFPPVSFLVYCYLLELLVRLFVCFHCWTDLITASLLDLDTEASLDLHLPPVFIHLQTASTHTAAERGDSLDSRRKSETFKEFKTSQPSAEEQGRCMAGLAESLCTAPAPGRATVTARLFSTDENIQIFHSSSFFTPSNSLWPFVLYLLKYPGHKYLYLRQRCKLALPVCLKWNARYYSPD